MANIHLKASGGNGKLHFGDPTMPKYVGARAEVTRTEEGVRIWLKDYLGETEETIFALKDATTSASGLMSSTDKTKLNGIASGAEANVQSDWNQTTTTADDYIKNKPTIPHNADDVGAIASPSSPSAGDFLVWDGSAWVAQSLSEWQGGSY